MIHLKNNKEQKLCKTKQINLCIYINCDCSIRNKHNIVVAYVNIMNSRTKTHSLSQ